MTGSSLVTKTMLLPGGFTNNRGGKKIRRVTPHIDAGGAGLESIYNTLKSGNISATYGLKDSELWQYIDEAFRPYTSSSAANDNEAITIEISNDKIIRETANKEVADKLKAAGQPVRAATYEELVVIGNRLGWPVSEESIKKLIELFVDVMRRYDFAPLVLGENLTWHSMFSVGRVCPGAMLLNRLQAIADECNRIVFPAPVPSPGASANTDEAWFHAWPFTREDGSTIYRVVKQVIALSDKGKAEAYAKELSENYRAN